MPLIDQHLAGSGTIAVLTLDLMTNPASFATFAAVMPEIAGYTAAFAGPVAAGIAFDQFGGAGSAIGCAAAFATMGLGSTAAAWAMQGAHR